jgi:hypothetical protein
MIYQGEKLDFWKINLPLEQVIEGKIEKIVDEAEIIYVKPIEKEDLPIEVPTPENIEEIRG